jgi:hypothetical protein
MVAAAALLADEGLGHIRELVLEPTAFRYPTVQPLANDMILVVNARMGAEDLPNAFVFDGLGHLVQRVMFGDAIEHVLVDRLNRAWVGYFDEGLFGNFGWDFGEGRVLLGPSGLVRFDLGIGKPDWSFTADGTVRAIYDCYALNVADDAVWLYYYDAFDLVRIDRDGSMRRWSTETRGARALAIGTDRTLLVGGYGDKHWEATLWSRAEVALENPCRVALALPDGSPPEGRAFGRGDRLYVWDGPRWYSSSINDIAEGGDSE